MDLNELYQIEPGQVALFISKEGINQRTARTVSELFMYFRRLYKDNSVNLAFIPTEDESLIWKLIGRNPQETGATYKVVLSSWDTVAGFSAEYFGEDIKKIIERVPSMGIASNLSISDAEPIIVYLDSNNSSSRAQIESYKDFDPYGMELKQVKPEKGSKAEKEFISRMERRLEKVLRDCAIFDIELDIDRIKKKVADSLKSKINYKLALDIASIKEGPLSFCTSCDIYVANKEEYKLDLTAVEKAIYLTFLLYENGIRIAETFDDFRRITQKIYNQLPDYDKCEKTAGGILDKGEVDPIVYTDTLRGYISKIRDEVASKIAHPLVAQDFAIEGFKNSEFGVAQSTPEIRAQIKQVFKL